MFERFTNRARHVVVMAQEEARDLQHNYIGTEHILLGLLGEPEGMAGQALTRLGFTSDGVRQEIISRVGLGKKPIGGHIPFTPRAKKVLELGLREALQLNHNYIGTEHILLGVIREGDGVAAQILIAQAQDLLTVRMAVLDLLPAGSAGSAGQGGRRWLRRRSAAPPGEEEQHGGQDEEVRTTPAADSSLDEAARLAGGQPVGSHHLLLAALGDGDSAASRALAALGVDLEQARAALRDADVAGTSDEQPEDAGRRQMLIRLDGDQLTIEAADEIIVGLGRAALAALGGQADVIRGDQPASASLSQVWQALRDSLEEIRIRASGGTSASTGAGSGPTPSGPAARHG
jgi:ATP-dependent Clp protease ATP-binding subunit ClpA